MAQPRIEPITSATLPEFARFLEHNMPVPRSAADWEAGLRCQWLPDAPNHGFMLRADDGAIVGGIGAYYAERSIKGRSEKFCNITSWCVLDAYRQQSMRLAMSVIKQPGFTFTDFSPTKVVAGTLKFFKFKELDERELVILNLPGLSATPGTLVVGQDAIEKRLSGPVLKAYQDHARFPWLRHFVVGDGNAWCHVVYKRTVFKGLASAYVIHLSDAALFHRHFRRIAAHLLLRGMVSTRVECRMLPSTPWPSRVRSGFIQKVFLSTSLEAQDIDYLYSETTALDL